MKRVFVYLLSAIVGIAFLGAMGVNPRYLEELIIGGGLSDTDGGVEIDRTGAITTTGPVDASDYRVNGTSGADGQVLVGQTELPPQWRTMSGDVQLSPTGDVQLVQDSVGSAEIADNAVGGSQVIDESLTAADIQDGTGSGLDADNLDGATWGAPLAIGNVAANSGSFTTLTASDVVTVSSNRRIGLGSNAHDARFRLVDATGATTDTCYLTDAHLTLEGVNDPGSTGRVLTLNGWPNTLKGMYGSLNLQSATATTGDCSIALDPICTSGKDAYAYLFRSIPTDARLAKLSLLRKGSAEERTVLFDTGDIWTYGTLSIGPASPVPYQAPGLLPGDAPSKGTIQMAGATGQITTSGDVAVNGGDITSTGALSISPGAGLTLNSGSNTDITLAPSGSGQVRTAKRLIPAGNYQGVGTNSLLAYWKFSELLPKDYSGNGYDFTSVGNGPLVTAGGRCGIGLQVAANQRLSTTSTTIPTTYGNASLSVSFWLKSTTGLGFFSLWYSGSKNFWWHLNSTGSMALRVNDVAADSGYFQDISGDGKWHHFAIVLNRANNTVSYYFDGLPTSASPRSFTAGDATVSSTVVNWGHLWGSTSPGTYDEVSIWSKALSDDEVLSLFLLGTELLSGTGLVDGTKLAASSVSGSRLNLLDTAPASATSIGTVGEVRFASDGYIYICVATNTWKRVQASAW